MIFIFFKIAGALVPRSTKSLSAVLRNIVYFTSLVFPAEFLQRRRAQKKNRATNQVKVPLPRVRLMASQIRFNG
jgi:hypothetical protein